MEERRTYQAQMRKEIERLHRRIEDLKDQAGALDAETKRKVIERLERVDALHEESSKLLGELETVEEISWSELREKLEVRFANLKNYLADHVTPYF